jgi:RHS repeat-associated protein
VTHFAYVGLQRRGCSYANGARVKNSYDGAGRLIDITHTFATSPPLTVQHLLDAANNVRVRHDFGVSDSGEKLAYDSLYRLVAADPDTRIPFDPVPFAALPDVPDPIPNRQAAIDLLIGELALPPVRGLGYDLVGNRTSEVLTAGTELVYVVNALDQYETRGSTTYDYDRNGNLLSDGRREYVYDSLNRLVRVRDAANGATIARFAHDARGRRIVEDYDGQVRQLVWDGDDLIAEYRGGKPFALYVYDDGIDQPVQTAVKGSEFWYHTDLDGSVRALSGGDGGPSADYRYTPFGQLTSAQALEPYNPQLFSARRIDRSIGTYDFRARQYDPELGRFQQRDPAGMTDGTNLYAYTRNNPIRFVDPRGTSRQERSSAVESWHMSEDAIEELARRNGIDTPNWLERAANWLGEAWFWGGRGPNAQARDRTLGPDQSIIRSVLDRGHGCAACHISNFVWGKFGPDGVNPENGLPWDWALNAKGYENWVARTSQARFFVEGMTSIGLTKLQTSAAWRSGSQAATAEVVASEVGALRRLGQRGVTQVDRTINLRGEASKSGWVGGVVELRGGVPVQLHRDRRIGPAFRSRAEAEAAIRDGGHVMEAAIRKNGREVARWWEASEPGYGGPYLGLSDTEQRALLRINLEPGLELEFTGTFPVCHTRRCFQSLDFVSAEHGVDITYRSPGFNAYFQGYGGHIEGFFKGDFKTTRAE